jgi:hypothetical protein
MLYSQYKEYIIIPVLKQMSIPYSEEAVELLAMTIAHESQGAKYIKQLGGGPACGHYQMEPATYMDIWENYLAYRNDLQIDLAAWGSCGDAEEMIGNLYYATAMARVHYWRVSEALPVLDRSQVELEYDFLVELAHYAKDHYNTHLGKATPEKYLSDYLTWRNEG